MRLSRAAIAVAFIVAPGLILPFVWPLAGLGAGEDDVMYYLPARVFFHDSVQRGEWPWINPYTGMGRPFMADPQSAVWYPLTWLFAVFSPLPAYAAHLWLHHVIAAWGMYRLLRGERGGRSSSVFEGLGNSGVNHQICRSAAVFGAIAFAFCGFVLAHRVHLTIHAGAAWAPWVFWRLGRLADRPGVRRLVAAVVVAALQTLSGHVQIAAITALGSLVWLAGRHISSADGEAGQRRPLLRVGVVWLATWICTACLCAIQLVPTVLYLGECDRGDRNYFEFTENSWHPVSLATFVTPFVFGNRADSALFPPYTGPSHQSEQFGYVGIVPLTLAVFAFFGGWRTRQRRGWVWLAVFSLLLAIGRFGPICPLLYLVPGANVFRVPARALLLVDLSLCALAASALHELVAQPLSPRVARLLSMVKRLVRESRVVVLVLLVACSSVGMAYLGMGQRLVWQGIALAMLTSGALWAASTWTVMRIANARCVAEAGGDQRAPSRAAILALVVLVVDFAWVGAHLDVPRGVRSAVQLLTSSDRDMIIAEIRREPAAANPWLARRLWVVNERDGDRFGEYDRPVAKLCADTNLLSLMGADEMMAAQTEIGISTLNDYGPMQPRAFNRTFRFAPWGFTPLVRRMLLVTDWMHEANVGWVLVCSQSMAAPRGGQLRLTTPSGFRLYRMPESRDMRPSSAPGVPDSREPARCNSFTTVATEMGGGESTGPRRTSLSYLALNGWSARMASSPDDSQPRVIMTYFPPGLLVGGIISAATVVLMCVCQTIRGQRRIT